MVCLDILISPLLSTKHPPYVQLRALALSEFHSFASLTHATVKVIPARETTHGQHGVVRVEERAGSQTEKEDRETEGNKTKEKEKRKNTGRPFKNRDS